MIIKKAKYKNVMVKQRKQTSPDVYGCDSCRNEIKEYPNEDSRLELTVWQKDKHGRTVDEKTEHLHFCSWKCLFDYVKTMKSNYFASMPFLYFEKDSGKRSASEFISLIKKINP